MLGIGPAGLVTGQGGTPPPPSPSSPAHPLPPAREIIQRHVAAIGGRDALLRVSSRFIWGRYEAPGLRLAGQVRLYSARPAKMVLKTEYPDVGISTRGFDGRNGWKSDPRGKAVLLRGSELDEVRDDATFDVDLHLDADVSSLETLDVSDFEARPCYRVRVVRSTMRQSIEFYDTTTGLLAGRVYRRESEKGPVTVRTILSRYKPFDGILIPTRVIFRGGGTEEIVTVMSVKHNAVDDGVFALPSQLRPLVGGPP